MPHVKRYLLLAGSLLFLGILFVAVIIFELLTSHFQAIYLSRFATKLHYHVEQGPSPLMRFPHSGPYDERYGYKRLPAYIEKLTSKGYKIAAQARFSRSLITLSDWGLFTIYPEKTQVKKRFLKVW